MNKQLFEEINLIINQLIPYFHFEELKEMFSLSFLSKNEKELEYNISCLNEVKIFLEKGKLDFIKIDNLSPILNMLKRNQVLDIIQIVEIKDLLILSSSFVSSINNDKLVSLNSDKSKINLYQNLINKINKIITPDNNIADNASNDLLSIRREINKTKKIVEETLLSNKEKYKTFLSEDFSSIKNGFNVLPIKAKSISNVPGYIVSYSSSKETAYIAPIEVLNIQNNLAQLENKELIEINKILSMISSELKKIVNELTSNYQILMKWDRFFACYIFGQTYNGTIGVCSNKLELNELFHLLIGKDESVKNSFSLSKDGTSMLFISGPNAGGKTVLLKSTCLAILMFNLSMLVPCLDISYFPFIKDVVLISGDSQSIENNLSTFSSHLKELKDITSLDQKTSFIAIDEICGGTSPSDGVALSLSIIDFLNKNKTYSMITSHFDDLKEHVFTNKNILVCSMEFNLNNLQPTFHLLTNSIGYSYGIELAKMMGLSNEIISSATEYKKKSDEYNIEQLTKKLNEEISSQKKLIISLQKKEKEIDELLNKKREVLDAIEKEKEAIHNKAKIKIEKEVNKKINELNIIFSKVNDLIPLNKQIEIKTEMKNLLSEETKSKKENIEIPQLKVGDKVLDEDNKYYEVFSIKKDKVVLTSDGIKFTRDIVGLKKSEYKEIKKNKSSYFYKNDYSDSLPLSLNVIGLTSEEALKEFEVYLSRASIKKYHSVKIIHGMGTYKLKNVLWNYLEKNELVKSYRLGIASEGGIGATIVELK